LAALSGDPTLVEIYNTGGDIHTDLANELFPGWDERNAGNRILKAIAKEQRVKCKNVNFGITYGITEFGLQGQIGGPIQDSRDMLEGWHAKYPVASEFIHRCRMTPTRNQIITTCFGRKKRVGLVSRENLHFLQNEAANFPHQSIASDITLHAAIRTWRLLLSWNVRIVNLIHDSLLLEAPITEDRDLRSRVIQLVAREMRQVPIDWGITRVPFMADAEYGHRWGSLKGYKGDMYE
jgi:DNA polymerase-1